MTTETVTSAMRRKAGAGRPEPELSRMTTERAWKVAVPRAVEKVLGVPAFAASAEESRAVRDDLSSLVSEHSLIALLEGFDDRLALAIVEPSLLSGVIEAAMTGRVSNRPGDPREPTRTDALIAADFLDELLDVFETGLEEMQEPPNVAGYRYAGPVHDARAVELMMPDGAYLVFRVQVDLGGGARQGDVVVLFPEVLPHEVVGSDVPDFHQTFVDNVLGSHADLDAVLHRLRMPLQRVSSLAVGDVLRIPLAALGTIQVEAPGGREIAGARLGQQGGFRAIRLTHLASEQTDGPAEEFTEAAPAATLSLDKP